LETFGVDLDTETVYLSMLQNPECGVDRLAELLGRPSPDVRRALDALAGLSLVTAEAGAVDRYAAIPPEQALEVLIAREEDRLEARRAHLADSRASIPALVQDYVDSRRTYVCDQVELLTEPQLVRSRLFQLTDEARETAWAIHPGGPLSAEAIAVALPLDKELTSRGVRCRMIVTTSSMGPAHWTEYLLQLQHLGQEVRVAGSADQRCIVVDSMHAVIPCSDDDRPGAYVLHGRSLVAPIVALFEEMWTHSDPLPEITAEADDRQITEARMRQVAILLARGIKDDAVARRLDVSVRTVRRLIAATMNELQAQSRFEAGVIAAHRGWVSNEARPE
jgi:DNA-binding CsgD family transcriptional regulator/sugar-specific transcriptional regulator TrmB